MENVAWVTVTNLHNYCATHMVQMMREWKANFFTFKYKQSNNSKGNLISISVVKIPYIKKRVKSRIVEKIPID